MRESLKRYVQRLNSRKFTNNVQRVLYRLLVDSEENGWVPTRSLRVSCADSRVRDLRKPEYGAFRVQCRRDKGVTSYRLTVRDLTVARLRTVFRNA